MSLAKEGIERQLDDAHEIIGYYNEYAAFVYISSLISNGSPREVIVANTILDFSEAWLGGVLPG